MVAAHPHPQIIGVGLDFNEIGFPSEDYGDAFRAAAEHGLHRTSHAGEIGPADNVRAAIDLLGCGRIDHGYHVVDDPDLVARCVETQIPFRPDAPGQAAEGSKDDTTNQARRAISLEKLPALACS